MDPFKLVKIEIEGAKDNLDLEIDVKIEEHPIKSEIKQETDPKEITPKVNLHKQLENKIDNRDVVSRRRRRRKKEKRNQCSHYDNTSLSEVAKLNHTKVLNGKKRHKCKFCEESFVN
ncbi:unnamed protein product, partial [Meganyctiphanes norvegica]